MNKKIEFNKIVKDIIKHDAFLKLQYEDHHGITRLEHSINVARVAYLISRKLKLKNINEITRSALLHDLFYTSELKGENSFIKHPIYAAENAIQYFDVSEREANAIKSHMFPMTKEMPSSLTAWMVTVSDKLVALYEMTRYKVPLKVGIYVFYLMLFIPLYSLPR